MHCSLLRVHVEDIHDLHCEGYSQQAAPHLAAFFSRLDRAPKNIMTDPAIQQNLSKLKGLMTSMLKSSHIG